MDEEALKKAAEKEKRRAQYAGKVFESKHPKQSQKEKSKDPKARSGGGGGGGGGANKANTKSITNENKESGSSASANNSSSNINSNNNIGGRRRGSLNNDSHTNNYTTLDNNIFAKSRLALFGEYMSINPYSDMMCH